MAHPRGERDTTVKKEFEEFKELQEDKRSFFSLPRAVLALADLLVHQPGERSIDATLLERHAKSCKAHLDPAKSAA